MILKYNSARENYTFCTKSIILRRHGLSWQKAREDTEFFPPSIWLFQHEVQTRDGFESSPALSFWPTALVAGHQVNRPS
jgi:hypothetical protein